MIRFMNCLDHRGGCERIPECVSTFFGPVVSYGPIGSKFCVNFYFCVECWPKAGRGEQTIKLVHVYGIHKCLIRDRVWLNQLCNACLDRKFDSVAGQ